MRVQFARTEASKASEKQQSDATAHSLVHEVTRHINFAPSWTKIFKL